MPLVDAASLVRNAAQDGYAVLQVNTNGGTYDLVRAIVEVADEERAPVILGAYEENLAYRGVAYAARLLRRFAEEAAVPVAVHLDHGSGVAACRRAIDAGFTSVMIDGSHLPIEANLALTQEVVALARPLGISVEAEVGELRQIAPDGAVREAANLADPADAARMSREAGIDMLAVGIGTAHGFYHGQPDVRFDLLGRLAAASAVPLVLHGTSGLADDIVTRCIELGIAKVNLGTLVRARYLQHLAAVIAEDAHQDHPWRVCQEAKDRIKPVIRHLVRLTGSAGKAP